MAAACTANPLKRSNADREERDHGVNAQRDFENFTKVSAYRSTRGRRSSFWPEKLRKPQEKARAVSLIARSLQF
jgi:hypothetical protein